MAANGANFYKYLEAAFRYRLFNPVGKTANANTIFRYLGYNLPFKRIFYYTRQVLPSYYRNTAEFPDTEEGNLKLARVILEKLDKHKDIQLEYQFKGTLTPEQERLILDQAEVESRQNEGGGQTVPAGTTGTSAGDIPFGVPSTGTPFKPRAPRIIIAEQTTPPVSGKAGGIGQGTAATNKSSMLEAERVGPATAKAARIQAESRTASLETTSLPVDNVPKKDLPQGIKGWKAESTATRIQSQQSLSRFNFSAFNSRVSNLARKVQNSTSPAGPFLKVNLNRVGNGLKNMFGGIGRGITGPGLTSTANVLGRTGLGAINHGGNFFSNLSNTKLRSGLSSALGGGKKVALVSTLAFLLIFGIALNGAVTGTTPTGGAAPIATPGGVATPQPSSSVIPSPLPSADGNYKKWIKDNFKINIDALTQIEAGWAYEVLNSTANIAPKFQDLIASKPTTVIPVPEGSHTSGDIISIRTGYDQNFFKQIFTHELGHRIKGTAGTTSPQCPSTGQTLEQIEKTEGYLTYYSEHATPAHVPKPACGSNDQTTQSDEDFAESVSYYINNTMQELNYGSGCSTYNQTTNPYKRTDQPRPTHKAYIQCLLGP